MSEGVLFLHVDEQLPPVAAFAELSEALHELLSGLTERASSQGGLDWALYEIEREWDGTTIELHLVGGNQPQPGCSIADIAETWLELACQLELDGSLKFPECVTRPAQRLRRVQREQEWTLTFAHRCPSTTHKAVIVPPAPVRLVSRQGVVSGPVQSALAGDSPQLVLLDSASNSSVRCYLNSDLEWVVADAMHQLATITGTILDDVASGRPIAAYEVTDVRFGVWDWDGWRDIAGMGRWNAGDQAAARLIDERRQRMPRCGNTGTPIAFCTD